MLFFHCFVVQFNFKNKEACPSFLDLFIELLKNPRGVRGGAGAPPRVAGGVPPRRPPTEISVYFLT